MQSIDLYEALGVGRSATADEIHQAYRRISRMAHPDAGGTAALFRLINEAYEVLSDEHRRADYDSAGDVLLGQSGYVSMAIVPDVTGADRHEAARRVLAAGLQPTSFAERIAFSDPRGGHVLRQDPSSGTSVPIGTHVSLIVALNDLPDLRSTARRAGSLIKLGLSKLNEGGSYLALIIVFPINTDYGVDYYSKSRLRAATGGCRS